MLPIQITTQVSEEAKRFLRAAATSESLGRFSDAFEWYLKALEIQESTLGPNNISMLTTVNRAASMLRRCAWPLHLLSVYEMFLSLARHALGIYSPITLKVYMDLGGVCAEIAVISDDTDSVLEGLVDNSNQGGGVNASRTWTAPLPPQVNGFHKQENSNAQPDGSSLRKAPKPFKYPLWGDVVHAEDQYTKVLRSLVKADQENPKMFQQSTQNFYIQKAERYYLHARDGFRMTRNWEGIAMCLEKLGELYSQMGKWPAALDAMKQALEHSREHLSWLDEKVLERATKVAIYANQTGDLLLAREMTRHVFEGYNTLHGPTASETLNVLLERGKVEHRLGSEANAEVYYEKALKGYVTVVPPGDPFLKSVVNNLKGYYAAAHSEWKKREETHIKFDKNGQQLGSSLKIDPFQNFVVYGLEPEFLSGDGIEELLKKVGLTEDGTLAAKHEQLVILRMPNEEPRAVL